MTLLDKAILPDTQPPTSDYEPSELDKIFGARGSSQEWRKEKIMEYVQQERLNAKIELLNTINQDSSLPPDCEDTCVEKDPEHPREAHWHHVIHKLVDDHIADLTKQLKEYEDSNEIQRE